MTVPPAPPESYWVLPGRLLAGRYPGSRYVDSETERKVWLLVQAGVTSLVDLTRPGEMPPYLPALDQAAGLVGKSIHYRRVDLPEEGIPSTAQVGAILDYLDAELAAGRVVYVHCRAGIDRTGTIIGCFLARHGRSGTAALQELAELRGVTAILSPGSDDLRQLVVNWLPGN